MKITIDTKEDSHEEIRKIIGMLNSLVEAEALSSPSSNPEPVIGEGIFGMFSNNKEETGPEQRAGGEVEGMLHENKEETVDIPEPKVVEGVKRDDDDEPRIVPY